MRRKLTATGNGNQSSCISNSNLTPITNDTTSNKQRIAIAQQQQQFEYLATTSDCNDVNNSDIVVIGNLEQYSGATLSALDDHQCSIVEKNARIIKWLHGCKLASLQH